jgi:WD40 repeat protein
MKILSQSFNQDYSLFSCGTEQGFIVFECKTFKKVKQCNFNDKDVVIVEMLFKSNLLCLVSSCLPNKVFIWDENKHESIGELSFRTDVKGIKFRRDCIVIVLEFKIYIYNFADLKLIDHIETIANPKGLCAINSAEADLKIFVCPSFQKGHVKIERFDVKKTNFIIAHQNDLVNLTLNYDGTKLATASTSGTQIKIFNSKTGSLLHELRRGLDKTEINCISFSNNSEWIACSSNKGTIHVFSLISNVSNLKSYWLPFSHFLPGYFTSEWSFSHFTKTPNIKYKIGFGSEDYTIIIIGEDDTIDNVTFDPLKPGQPCILLDQFRISHS